MTGFAQKVRVGRYSATQDGWHAMCSDSNGAAA